MSQNTNFIVGIGGEDLGTVIENFQSKSLKINMTESIAIGNLIPGAPSQGVNSIMIGNSAGITSSQGNFAIAIGDYAGRTTQGGNTVAIGTNAGLSSQGGNAIAIGFNAGSVTQLSDAIAIGRGAGQTSQQPGAITIGEGAGQTNQQPGAIAIGQGAAQTSQGSRSIAIGQNAGTTAQGSSCVAIGLSAGNGTQRNNAVAIGGFAGQIDQSGNATALGYNAGNNKQGPNAVAIGLNAGQGITLGQGQNAIAIGVNSARTSQSLNAIAIGNAAGDDIQGEDGIAIGRLAGQTSQALEGIAIGVAAAETTQGEYGIAIGRAAGRYLQLTEAIAIGRFAGQGVAATPANQQKDKSIAIGKYAGALGQGANSISIGGYTGLPTGIQAANCIQINATDTAIAQTTASSCIIAPIRAAAPVSANNSLPLLYDTTTKEVFTNISASIALSANNTANTNQYNTLMYLQTSDQSYNFPTAIVNFPATMTIQNFQIASSTLKLATGSNNLWVYGLSSSKNYTIRPYECVTFAADGTNWVQSSRNDLGGNYSGSFISSSPLTLNGTIIFSSISPVPQGTYIVTANMDWSALSGTKITNIFGFIEDEGAFYIATDRRVVNIQAQTTISESVNLSAVRSMPGTTAGGSRYFRCGIAFTFTGSPNSVSATNTDFSFRAFRIA